MTDDLDHGHGETIIVPITDTIDLHHFNPKEIKDLIHEYIRACREQRIFSVRIIHGKGKGLLKDHVHRILTNHPHVVSFSDGGQGNWGATRAELKPI